VLERSAHVYFGKGYVGFKPTNCATDGKWLDLDFRFLSPSTHPGDVSYSRDPRKMSTFCDHRDLDKQPDHISGVEPPKLIKSGAIIYFETDDPQNFPLLDFELAELAWYLNQVAAMKAAADIIIPFFRRRDDDEDEYLMSNSRKIGDLDRQTAAYEHEETSMMGSTPTSNLSALK
jgi:hypothetical protein